MLLAVGVISTGVFILSPGLWEQVRWEHSAKVVHLFQHSKETGGAVLGVARRRGGTPLSF